jgi:hypothetical protein
MSLSDMQEISDISENFFFENKKPERNESSEKKKWKEIERGMRF